MHSTKGSKLFSYISDYLSSYAEKLNIWNGPDYRDLLMKSGKGSGKTSLDAIYKWKKDGYSLGNIYERALELHMPIKFLPNCSRFEAVVAPLNCIAALFGIPLRGKGSEIRIRNWRNGRANRALFRYFLDLGRLRDEGKMEAY